MIWLVNSSAYFANLLNVFLADHINTMLVENSEEIVSLAMT